MERRGGEETPWYRQFWPWFVIALPASAVVAGIATLLIAMHEPDALVVDDYYKQGLAINKDLARERRAAELGLRAELLLPAQDGELLLELSSSRPFTPPPALQLVMTHPTLAERDRKVVLARDGEGRYRAAFGGLREGEWLIRLEPLDQAWRLVRKSRVEGGERLVLGGEPPGMGSRRPPGRPSPLSGPRGTHQYVPACQIPTGCQPSSGLSAREKSACTASRGSPPR